MELPHAARELMTRGKVIALATSDKTGKPNVAPMMQYWWTSEDTLVIGDFFMKASARNVRENGFASFVVWNEETREAYKFCGAARYVTSGPEYDLANAEMRKKKPEKTFKGAIVIQVTAVYDQKSGSTAGNRIA